MYAHHAPKPPPLSFSNFTTPLKQPDSSKKPIFPFTKNPNLMRFQTQNTEIKHLPILIRQWIYRNSPKNPHAPALFQEKIAERVTAWFFFFGCEQKMPSVAVKLYSVFFKFLLKHRLQNRIQSPPDESNLFGVTSRPEETVAAANPSFTDGVATKDIHIDPFTSLTIRIFLPDSALNPPEPDSRSNNHNYPPRPKFRSNHTKRADPDQGVGSNRTFRRNSYGPPNVTLSPSEEPRRNSYGSSNDMEGLNLMSTSAAAAGGGVYRGYSPSPDNRRKLPVMLQFHGGGWVSGSNDSAANDLFCRRIAKQCDVIVVAVGYRLAPENRYPAAFEDGLKVLNWLGKQANLAECSKSMGNARGGGGGGGGGNNEFKKSHIVDTFGASMVEPWLAAHGDPSRLHFWSHCAILFSSCLDVKKIVNFMLYAAKDDKIRWDFDSYYWFPLHNTVCRHTVKLGV